MERPSGVDCFGNRDSNGLNHSHLNVHPPEHDAAVGALNTGAIGGRLPENPLLREELETLRTWWDRACWAIDADMDSATLPLSEADDVACWCVTLAQEIVNAELAYRSGKQSLLSLSEVQRLIWNRFKNLEMGLHSDGSPRRPIWKQ